MKVRESGRRRANASHSCAGPVNRSTRAITSTELTARRARRQDVRKLETLGDAAESEFRQQSLEQRQRRPQPAVVAHARETRDREPRLVGIDLPRMDVERAGTPCASCSRNARSDQREREMAQIRAAGGGKCACRAMCVVASGNSTIVPPARWIRCGTGGASDSRSRADESETGSSRSDSLPRSARRTPTPCPA